MFGMAYEAAAQEIEPERQSSPRVIATVSSLIEPKAP